MEFRTAEVISECHQNLTLYTILKLEKSHNISQLADWRKRYGIGDYIENLKNKIQLEQLKHITLLSPETSKDLKELADSKISDMNFTQFTTLLENEITKIDLKAEDPEGPGLQSIVILQPCLARTLGSSQYFLSSNLSSPVTWTTITRAIYTRVGN